jgi:hypothetical protein
VTNDDGRPIPWEDMYLRSVFVTSITLSGRFHRGPCDMLQVEWMEFISRIWCPTKLMDWRKEILARNIRKYCTLAQKF